MGEVKKKETQLQRVIRRAEAGEIGKGYYTVRISRYGYSLTRLGVKERGLTRVAKNLAKKAPEIFRLLKKAKKATK